MKNELVLDLLESAGNRGASHEDFNQATPLLPCDRFVEPLP